MPKSKLNSFGARLRTLRLQKGWTQQILADHAGLTRESISSLENGRSDTTIRTLYDLATALGTTMSDML
jgi:transcriptional regulator with XRE-family HTH domain